MSETKAEFKFPDKLVRLGSLLCNSCLADQGLALYDTETVQMVLCSACVAAQYDQKAEVADATL